MTTPALGGKCSKFGACQLPSSSLESAHASPMPLKFDQPGLRMDAGLKMDGAAWVPSPSTPPLPDYLIRMPTDLNTSIDFLKLRVDKTLSVQDQIKTTWLWRHRTMAQWNEVSSDLDKSVDGSMAQVAIAAQTAFNAATGALDMRLARIHEITVPIVESMRTEADRNPELKAVVNDLSGRGGPRGVIEDEGTALLSAWELEFGGAAFAPAPGSEMTFDAFNALFVGRAADPGATPPVTALPSLRTLKRAQSDAATVQRREAGRVGKRLALIEKDCQDWYAEATRYFPAGTEIGDLIRGEIPTTSDYNPPTPAPPPTPPTPPTP